MYTFTFTFPRRNITQRRVSVFQFFIKAKSQVLCFSCYKCKTSQVRKSSYTEKIKQKSSETYTLCIYTKHLRFPTFLFYFFMSHSDTFVYIQRFTLVKDSFENTCSTQQDVRHLHDIKTFNTLKLTLTNFIIHVKTKFNSFERPLVQSTSHPHLQILDFPRLYSPLCVLTSLLHFSFRGV